MPLDKGQVPVNATDCAFGQWYYGTGQRFRPLPAFRDIEEHHDALHKTYREIFVLLFGEDKNESSFFGRLFGSAQKANAEKHTRAKDKYKGLEQESKTIMKKLDDLENLVSAMSQEQLDSYLNKAH